MGYINIRIGKQENCFIHRHHNLCRSNIQKFTVFLYASNEHSKNQIIIIPVPIASKLIKFLGINLSVKLIYWKLRTLLREIKDLNNGETLQVHGLEDSILS